VKVGFTDATPCPLGCAFGTLVTENGGGLVDATGGWMVGRRAITPFLECLTCRAAEMTRTGNRAPPANQSRRRQARDLQAPDLDEGEKTVWQRQAELFTLLDMVPQQIFVLRPNLDVEYANKALVNYHGEALRDVLLGDDVERRDRLVFHPDDVPRLREARRAGSRRGCPSSPRSECAATTASTAGS
jgi:PAS domain-containing protein